MKFFISSWDQPCNVVLLAVVLDNLVCTETLVAFFTVHKRIGEAAKMSGSDPGLRVHQNGTVNTYIVWRFLNEFLPPCTLYVIFKLYAKVSVVPCIGKAAINLRTRIFSFCKVLPRTQFRTFRHFVRS